MFATRGPSRLECESRVRGGVYSASIPSKTHEPSSTYFCRHVLPVSGETNADTRVAPNIDS